MKDKKFTSKEMEALVEKIAQTYQGDSGINFIDASNLPVKLLKFSICLQSLFFRAIPEKELSQNRISNSWLSISSIMSIPNLPSK